MHTQTIDRCARGLRWAASALALAALAMASGCGSSESNEKIFEDVTASSGLATHVGTTHGAYWGDFDGDGLPDVYVTNHLDNAQLFRNLGTGRFADVSLQMFDPADLGGDKHGAAWADFANDGQLDLIQLTGAVQGVGQEAKKLFVRRGDRFEDVAASLGVANPLGRTRMPLWVDFNRDGKLDLFEGAESRLDDQTPPFTFIQHEGRFDVATDALKLASRSVPFCVVTEITQDRYPELVCRTQGKSGTSQAFETSSLPAKPLDVLPATAFEDVAAGDFDNDGAIDLFLARRTPAGRVAFGRANTNELTADVSVDEADAAKPTGFRFRSSGKLRFRIASVYSPDALTTDRIYIGARGTHPGALNFSVSADTPGLEDAMRADRAPGVYISFKAPDKWQVDIVGAPRAGWGVKGHTLQLAFKVASAEAVTEVEGIGDSAKAEEAPQRLFMNRSGKLVEEGDKRGVNKRPIAAVNVVAGDFNNDMLLDLFILGSGEVGSVDSVLLLNRGDGKFQSVAQAGGAAGPRMGVGDSVTTVDFDRDGCLDLFIASGGSMGRGLGMPSEAGQYRLLHNLCNQGNHWLEIDLQGTTSNRDAIGARVTLTAGGVTQTRMQDGGIHERGQNHSRLHFGLAKNARADKIVVRWPSGTVQEIAGVDADRIVRITEPSK